LQMQIYISPYTTNKFSTATPTRVTTLINSDHLSLSHAQHKSSCCLHITHSFSQDPPCSLHRWYR